MATTPVRGRGGISNQTSRFDALKRESFDDEWVKSDEEAAPKPATTVSFEKARSIISRNDSPDIPQPKYCARHWQIPLMYPGSLHWAQTPTPTSPSSAGWSSPR